jgi:hypothetical protein
MKQAYQQSMMFLNPVLIGTGIKAKHTIMIRIADEKYLLNKKNCSFLQFFSDACGIEIAVFLYAAAGNTQQLFGIRRQHKLRLQQMLMLERGPVKGQSLRYTI